MIFSEFRQIKFYLSDIHSICDSGARTGNLISFTFCSVRRVKNNWAANFLIWYMGISMLRVQTHTTTAFRPQNVTPMYELESVLWTNLSVFRKI